jgi:hypothetical protein
VEHVKCYPVCSILPRNACAITLCVTTTTTTGATTIDIITKLISFVIISVE